MGETSEMTLTFRCPRGLEGVLPKPIPAVLGLPDWFKALPQRAFNPTVGGQTHTVKKCPPFVDAMTYGFLIPLATDLEVHDGEFNWKFDLPESVVSDYSYSSPIDFHDPESDCRYAVIRRGSVHHQVQQFLDHRSPEGLFAIVYTPGQSRRFAVHHVDRHGRLRCVLSEPDQFSGALDRFKIQRLAPKGHAHRPMFPGETRDLGRPL